VSPDGRYFAVPTPEGIHVRRSDQTAFRVLPGTAGAIDPSFSPDGAWIAFRQGGDLRKVGVEGSASLTLVSEAGMTVLDPAWGEDGNIVFATPLGVYVIPGAGGIPRHVGPAALGRRPRLLPDGSGVIVRNEYGLALLDLESDSLIPIVSEGMDGTYVETGHIIYGHPEGGLFAVPFELATHTVTGGPIPIMSEVSTFSGDALYAVSRNGTFVFAWGEVLTGGVPGHLIVLTLDGDRDTIPLAPRVYGGLSVAPGGRYVAFNVGSGRTLDRTVHTYDLLLGTTTQITFEGGGHRPVWSPDGTQVAYSARGEGADAEDLFIKAVDGSTPPRLVVALPGDQHASDWPSDHLIAFNDRGNLSLVDISTDDPEVRPYLRGEYPELDLVVSPSGDFAAYVSQEQGESEIFVRQFPDPAGQWRISDTPGQSPRWAPSGETLYYQTAVGDTIIAVTVSRTPPITPMSRRVVAVVPGLDQWDVDQASGNIVMVQLTGPAEPAAVQRSLEVVVNWFEELRSKVGQ
jgi:serine/threonine-protein kinase